jgi:hypothetical protein
VRWPDPGERDQAQDPADDDERLQREAEGEPGREQLREAVIGEQREAHSAQDEDHEQEQQRRDPNEPQLLRERGVDEVGVQVRDQRLSLGGRERPLAEAGAEPAAVRERVERLDELEAGAVLAQRRVPVQRAVDGLVRPRVQPDRHAVVDVLDLRIDERGAAHEERQPDRREQDPAGRDVEHRQEDPEVEERRAEVVRLDEDEHRAAPDHEQRPEVLQPSLGEHLALLAEIAREEDDQSDLRQLARLELKRPEVHPQARAVDGRAEHG